MKKILLTFILLILVGCGQEQGIEASKGIFPYIENFKREMGIKEISDHILTVIITPLENIKKASKSDEALAICMKGNYRDTVMIPEEWLSYVIKNSYFAEYRIELLIYHELGHCSLNYMDHDDRMLSNGHPASIMNSYEMGSYEDLEYYKNNREYYINDLRSKK